MSGSGQPPATPEAGDPSLLAPEAMADIDLGLPNLPIDSNEQIGPTTDAMIKVAFSLIPEGKLGFTYDLPDGRLVEVGQTGVTQKVFVTLPEKVGDGKHREVKLGVQRKAPDIEMTAAIVPANEGVFSVKGPKSARLLPDTDFVTVTDLDSGHSDETRRATEAGGPAERVAIANKVFETLGIGITDTATTIKEETEKAAKLEAETAEVHEHIETTAQSIADQAAVLVPEGARFGQTQIRLPDGGQLEITDNGHGRQEVSLRTMDDQGERTFISIQTGSNNPGFRLHMLREFVGFRIEPNSSTITRINREGKGENPETSETVLPSMQRELADEVLDTLSTSVEKALELRQSEIEKELAQQAMTAQIHAGLTSLVPKVKAVAEQQAAEVKAAEARAKAEADQALLADFM
jgi:hypothetical protein